MKNNGFTLVELLAVIVILAIVLVIAVPQIMNTINGSKIGILKSTALLIAKTAEKKKIENEVLGNTKPIKCKDIVKLNEDDYSVCNVKFDENDNAVVMLKGKKDGKFNRMMCTGTSNNMKCKELEQGLNCTFDGEAVNGATYVNGQYTYTYDDTNKGWSVILTDKESTDSVTTKVCSYINGRPIVATKSMFEDSKTISIDLSGFDTSNVTNMSRMFADSSVIRLDLSELDTSNVINMKNLFSNSNINSIDLSGFDTSNVTDMSAMFYQSKATKIDVSGFNTSNVTQMYSMFCSAQMEELDLSSFDTNKVVDMNLMFSYINVSVLDISSFDMSNAIDISGMFLSSKIGTLSSKNFNAINTIYMASLFEEAQIDVLDLSVFNANKVADMSSIFKGAKIFVLDLSGFDTSRLSNTSNMFKDCTATKGYARTQADADKFNASSNKPEGLVFTVK